MKRRLLERGSLILFIAVALPFIFFALAVSIDVNGFFTSRRVLLSYLEEYLYNEVPLTSFGKSNQEVEALLQKTLVQRMSSEISLSSALTICGTTAKRESDGTIVAAIGAEYQLSFADLLYRFIDRDGMRGRQGVPFITAVEARSAPVNMVIALDLGESSVPSEGQLKAVSGGEIPGWPSAEYFKKRKYRELNIPYDKRIDLESAARLTYSCFNPIINQMKLTAIRLWENTSLDPLNAAAVLFFPGMTKEYEYRSPGSVEGASLLGCGAELSYGGGSPRYKTGGYGADIVRPLSLYKKNTPLEGIPERGEASFPCTESRYGSTVSCTEVAEEAGRMGEASPSLSHFALPSSVRSSVHRIIGADKRYSYDALNALSIPQALWTRSAFDEEGEVRFDELLHNINQELFSRGSQDEGRGGLALGVEHVVVVLTPRSIPSTSEAENKFKAAISEMLEGTLSAEGALQLYWVTVVPDFFSTKDSTFIDEAKKKASRVQSLLDETKNDHIPSSAEANDSLKLFSLVIDNPSFLASDITEMIRANSQRMVIRERGMVAPELVACK